MLRVTIELIPGGYMDHPRRAVIGVMDIYNDGTGTQSTGNYGGRVFAKGSKRVIRDQGKVTNYPRLRKPVWCLVVQMLKSMGYG